MITLVLNDSKCVNVHTSNYVPTTNFMYLHFNTVHSASYLGQALTLEWVVSHPIAFYRHTNTHTKQHSTCVFNPFYTATCTLFHDPHVTMALINL